MLLLRERPPLDRLVALIKMINPTGRVRERAEAEARYALKSRLQSALVRCYGEDIVPEVDPAVPGAVLLRHELLDLDACHAILASLDEDARTLVEHALEARPATRTPPPSQRRRGPSGRSAAGSLHDVAALMREATAAAESYDYELARELLGRAFRASGGALPPALALLELLVDHLAADEDALALEDGLGDAAARSPEVASFLALAAARAGQAERARRLATAGDARAANALVYLAREGIRRGDLERARHDLDAARATSPSHSELHGVTEALARARATAREPHERRITDALADGRQGDAEAAAMEALARWPDSEVARRALRAIEAARREAKVAALRALGLAACANGRIEDAERTLATIQALAAHAPELVAAIGALRAQRDSHRAEQRFEDAMRAYREGEIESLLRAWSTLPEALQRRLREATGEETLDHMGRLSRTRSIDLDAAVAACLALRAVSSSRSALHPDEVVARLAPHEETLAHVAAARSLIAAARAAITERQRAAVEVRLEAARRALEGGGARAARAALDGFDEARLTAAQQETLRALRQNIERSATIEALVGEVATARAAGDPLRMLIAVDALLAMEVPDAPDWLGLRGVLRAQVRRGWGVQVSESRGPATELDDLSVHPRLPDEPDVLLSADGEEAVFVVTLENRVFVRVVHVPSGEVVRRIALRVPGRLHQEHAVLRGSVVDIVGDDGCALTLDIACGDVIRWVDLVAHRRSKERFEAIFVLDEGRIAWGQLSSAEPGARGRVVVVDVPTGRSLRDMETLYSRRVWGIPEAQMALFLAGGEVRFYGARGGGARWPSAIRDESVVGIAALSDRGALVTLREPDVVDAAPTLVVTGRDGRSVNGPTFTGCTYEGGAVLAPVASPRGVVVDLATATGDGRRMHWVAATEDRLQVEGTLAHEGGLHILCDVTMRRAVLASWHEQGVRFEALPGAIHATSPRNDRRWERVTGVSDFHRCHRPYVLVPRTHNPRELLRRASVEELPGLAARLRTATRTPQEIVDLGYELLFLPAQDEAGATFRYGIERYPEEWSFYEAVADGLWMRGAWQQVASVLAPAVARPTCPMHLLHIMGAALMHLGAFDEARAVLLRASKDEGGCDLRDIVIFAGLRRVYLPSPRRLAARVLAHCRRADVLIAEGRFDAAVRLFRRPPLCGLSDPQVSARRAVALLASPVSDPSLRFHKAIALARLVDAVRERFAPSTVVFDGAWSREQVSSVAAAATRWLEEVFDAGSPDVASHVDRSGSD